MRIASGGDERAGRDGIGRGGLWIGCEIARLIQAAEDLPGDSAGHGAADELATGEKDDDDEFTVAHFIETAKPAEMSFMVGVGAGAGLAKNRFVIVVASAAAGAEIDSALHAWAHLENGGLDVLNAAAHLRDEGFNFCLGARVLKIIHRAAVSDGADDRSELQGREVDAIAKASHHADAAGNFLVGPDAGLLTRDVEASGLTEAEQFSVTRDFLVAEFSTDGGEIGVIAMGDGLGHVHIGAATEFDYFVMGIFTFHDASNACKKFDCGAGLEAVLEYQLLVDHAEDATGRGVCYDDRTVDAVEGLYCGAADGEIFTIDDIT